MTMNPEKSGYPIFATASSSLRWAFAKRTTPAHAGCPIHAASSHEWAFAKRPLDESTNQVPA